MSKVEGTDLSNWRTPPYNQWAFRNVGKLIATETIGSAKQAESLNSSPQSFDGFKVQLGQGQPLDLSAFIDHTSTDAIIVLHKGNVVFEKYGNGNDEKSKHIMMSMTKSITGLVAGILAERGQLDVNATVSKYVPEVEGTPYEGRTVRHLLDMRSGIKHDDQSHAYRMAMGWEPVHEDEQPSDLEKFIRDLQAPGSKPPGGPFEYVSVNTDLCGWVIERATGKKLAELISEHIWQPMGAESDAIITVDSAGHGRAAGGMCATVRDLARVGQMIIDGKIVPGSWIDDIIASSEDNREVFGASPWAGMYEGTFEHVAYRTFWVADSEQRVMVALGIFGQTLVVDTVNGIVMAKFSSQGANTDFRKMILHTLAFQEFRRILLS